MKYSDWYCYWETVEISLAYNVVLQYYLCDSKGHISLSVAVAYAVSKPSARDLPEKR